MAKISIVREIVNEFTRGWSEGTLAYCQATVSHQMSDRVE